MAGSIKTKSKQLLKLLQQSLEEQVPPYGQLPRMRLRDNHAEPICCFNAQLCLLLGLLPKLLANTLGIEVYFEI